MGTDPLCIRAHICSVYIETYPFQISFTLERIHCQVQPRFQHSDPNLITKRREICLDFDPYQFWNGSNRLHQNEHGSK